jgi:colanic acid biosynthesis glycosyl transferase WcaI
MRVLLLTQLFQPEPNHLKGLAFAKRLVNAGHHVEVLTCFPNYPGGRVYDGYRIRPIQREILEGVRVTRVASYPSHDNSPFHRFLTYATFSISATAATLSFLRRFDIIHVCMGPATLALPGAVLAATTRAKLIIDIQDLWPESVISSGMLRNRFLLWILEKWVRATYRIAASVIVLSEGYRNTVCSRGAKTAKVYVVHNWSSELPVAEPLRVPEDFACLLAKHKSIILFAGTMGRVQALDRVIDAAELLQSTNPDLHFVFLGGGVEVEHLRKIVFSKRLQNVAFFPRVQQSAMSSIFFCATALLIHLRRDLLGSIGIPQKTQAYLAAGKPIVMAVHGEAADIVRTAKAGIVCEPEDPVSIATGVRQLLEMSLSERERLGNNGKKYYDDNLCFDIGFKKVLQVYQRTLNGRVD